jgi:hypothetical protein
MAAYEFSQGPAPLAPASSKSGRPLYREPGVPRKPANMMYDRRVVRGNTYAAPVIPPVGCLELHHATRSAAWSNGGSGCHCVKTWEKRSSHDSTLGASLVIVATAAVHGV